MKRNIILTALLLCSFSQISLAQFQETEIQNTEETSSQDNKWYFGFGGGFHSNIMKYSDLDQDLFPENKNLNSGVFSFFVQYDFGKQSHWSVRPEISLLKRGGKLTNIGKDVYDYESQDIHDLFYQLSSRYFDIRIPIIYNFGNEACAVRPYIYVAPILGFPTRGDIKMEEQYTDGYYDGYSLDLSKANMATCYFAASAGIGLKYKFRNACFLGIEANYEYGFTDTYGKKEKDGDAFVNTDIFPEGTYIKGDRKFSGFEIKATLGVPFNIFKKKEKTVAPAPTPVFVDTIRVTVKEKPCYTLEEITEMVEQHQSVVGKTICAIDIINFDFGKSNIKAESFEYLDKIAAILIKTNARVKVKGYTDNVGSEDFNMKLSKERAESVVNYLIRKGVDKNKVSYSYYGMLQPLSSNDTEEGRTINRRVEFEILDNQ